MKYRIENIHVNGVKTYYGAYIRRPYLWLFTYDDYVGLFDTEKEAVEFIEERIRLEKKYS